MADLKQADSELRKLAAQVKQFRCGNCGFRGNAHEMSVHAAIRHEFCDDQNCAACKMKNSGIGDRG